MERASGKKLKEKFLSFSMVIKEHIYSPIHTYIPLKMEGTDGTSLLDTGEEVELLGKLQRKFKTPDLPLSPPPDQLLGS